MTVFRTFWKIVKKYKGTIIMYTTMLIIFGGMNMTNKESQMDFVSTKPDVLIINKDNSKLSDNLIKYIKSNSNFIKIENDEEKINDALFYRDVNYVIYIPKDYGKDTLNNKKTTIDIKMTGDYQSSLAELMLKRYIKTENIYKEIATDEKELIELINNNLSKSTDVQIMSKLDTSTLSSVSMYFSFASYSLMAIIIFIICLVLSSFKEKTVNKRIIISSMNYKEHNKKLLLSSFTYTLIVWILFIILGIIILGDILFTKRGIIYMLNSFVFTFCSLMIALLINTLIKDKNAISGIVNVISLGSAFLCGAFVPAEWLPNSVLKIAHILPSYWYINTNDLLKTIEHINIATLKPIFINFIMLFIFSLFFLLINNIITKHKQKIS